MGGRKPTSFGSARIQIEGQPSSTELIVLSRMLFLICLDGLVQLLLADVTPGTDRVAHDLDVEFRHGAKGRAEHEPKTREEIMCERDVAVDEEFGGRMPLYIVSALGRFPSMTRDFRSVLFGSLGFCGRRPGEALDRSDEMEKWRRGLVNKFVGAGGALLRFCGMFCMHFLGLIMFFLY